MRTIKRAAEKGKVHEHEVRVDPNRQAPRLTDNVVKEPRVVDSAYRSVVQDPKQVNAMPTRSTFAPLAAQRSKGVSFTTHGPIRPAAKLPNVQDRQGLDATKKSNEGANKTVTGSADGLGVAGLQLPGVWFDPAKRVALLKEQGFESELGVVELLGANGRMQRKAPDAHWFYPAGSVGSTLWLEKVDAMLQTDTGFAYLQRTEAYKGEPSLRVMRIEDAKAVEVTSLPAVDSVAVSKVSYASARKDERFITVAPFVDGSPTIIELPTAANHIALSPNGASLAVSRFERRPADNASKLHFDTIVEIYDVKSKTIISTTRVEASESLSVSFDLKGEKVLIERASDIRMRSVVKGIVTLPVPVKSAASPAASNR
jgi:hypothetical protein